MRQETIAQRDGAWRKSRRRASRRVFKGVLGGGGSDARPRLGEERVEPVVGRRVGSAHFSFSHELAQRGAGAERADFDVGDAPAREPRDFLEGRSSSSSKVMTSRSFGDN